MGAAYQVVGSITKAGIHVVHFGTGSKVTEMATKTALKKAANVVDKDILPACREARGLSQYSKLLRLW